jgi:hypothetical protein
MKTNSKKIPKNSSLHILLAVGLLRRPKFKLLGLCEKAAILAPMIIIEYTGHQVQKHQNF